MSTDLFKSNEQMPDPDNTEIAVRTAQSFREFEANNAVPARIPNFRGDVKNIVRARRGYTTY